MSMSVTYRLVSCWVPWVNWRRLYTDDWQCTPTHLLWVSHSHSHIIYWHVEPELADGDVKAKVGAHDWCWQIVWTGISERSLCYQVYECHKQHPCLRSMLGQNAARQCFFSRDVNRPLWWSVVMTDVHGSSWWLTVEESPRSQLNMAILWKHVICTDLTVKQWISSSLVEITCHTVLPVTWQQRPFLCYDK